MSQYFVTGGAGFIGSAFVRVLLAQFPSCQVINLDSLTYAGNLDNLQGLDKSRHQLIRGDIAHRDDVFGALTEKTDAIINFAAESHVDRSILSADEFIRTNVLGTQVLLDAARERGVRRFIQISTDEVMGSLPENKKAFFSEESPFAPNSPYAASKAAAEHLVRAAHHTFGLDAVITRCGNNYGPRQFPEKFLPLMLANAMKDEPIPVYGDGLNVRDWIYVDDHCHAILLVLAKGRAGATYNIGARNEPEVSWPRWVNRSRLFVSSKIAPVTIAVTRSIHRWLRTNWGGLRVRRGKAVCVKRSTGTAPTLSGLSGLAAALIANSMRDNTESRSARVESPDYRSSRTGRSCSQGKLPGRE